MSNGGVFVGWGWGFGVVLEFEGVVGFEGGLDGVYVVLDLLFEGELVHVFCGLIVCLLFLVG